MAPDRDVSAGFPVKRLVLMLVYANMICLGGAFVALITLGFYSLIQFAFFSGYGPAGGEVFEILGFFHEAMEEMWDFLIDDLDQAVRFLMLAIIPGTVGGIVWYLILRWRESVILRKRLRDARSKAKAAREAVASA